MSDAPQTVVIVPCSGIGKPFGSVSREAAYEICEGLCPEGTRLVALSKLVLGDSTARQIVKQNPTVTIDGCPKMCAAKMVRQSGGRIVKEATVFDAYRLHKELKPEGIAVLNEKGMKLARVLAEEIAETVAEIICSKSARGSAHACST
jgi:uncharacterized metal-binding protein